MQFAGKFEGGIESFLFFPLPVNVLPYLCGVEVLLDVGQLDEEKEEKEEKGEKEEKEEKARRRLLLILLISVVNTFLPDKVDTLLPTWQKIS